MPIEFRTKTTEIITALKPLKVVPVLVAEDTETGVEICNILCRNGLKTAEITFRTKVAEELIKEASSAFPEMIIGAGTILTTEDLRKAQKAGARFAVAPGFNPKIVAEAVSAAFPFMPGVCTPTEMEQAMELGVRDFKFFPAESAGGVPFLKNIIAPYAHLGITFMPTGGVNPDNIQDYLSIPQVTVAGGTWLAKRGLSLEEIESHVKTTVKELEIPQ